MEFLKMLFSKKAPEDPEIVRLTDCGSDVETELILGILKENDIPCMAKDQHAGSVSRLYMGFSLSGSSIYVRREDEARARELLEIFRREDGEGAPDETGTPEESDGNTSEN